MKERICNNCQWFVEETEEVGDYQHDEAVRCGHGFCLQEDLFHDVESDDLACIDFCED